MSDPRAEVSFEEIGLHLTSFKSTGLTANDAPTGGDSNTGAAVTMVDNATVGKGDAGDKLVGQVKKYESDGIVSVADAGYLTIGYSGSAPTLGESVECDGDGKVQIATSNNVSTNIVVSVDTTNKLVTFKL